MTYQPDELIDRALQSLRDTQPPTGLEARVAARLAQAAEARSVRSPHRALAHSLFAKATTPSQFFAVILSVTKAPRIMLAEAPLYALATTVLLAFVLLAISHHRSAFNPTTIADSNPSKAIHPTEAVKPFQAFSPATTQAPQAFSLGSHSHHKKEGALALAPTDPDALALAETLAPSRPAPPMPLTAQEHLLLLATRQGQPIELAELETLRQPSLQAAADLHQRALIRRYAQSLLGPLAAAEALNPTSPPPSPDDTQTSQQPSSK